MAVTATLRSHGVLQNMAVKPSSKPSRKVNADVRNSCNPNGAAAKARRRKRSAVNSFPVKGNKERSRGQPVVARSPTVMAKGLVMGQVKILKRGEPLDLAPAKKEDDGEDMCSGDLGSGTESEIVKSEIRVDEDLALESMDRLKRDSEMVKNEIRFDGDFEGWGSRDPAMVKKVIQLDGINEVYAGSRIFVSPPPSSLPYPSFLVGNGISTSGVRLRRLLKLD